MTLTKDEMIETIYEAALDMGQSGKLTDQPILVDTSMLLLRLAQHSEHHRTDGRPTEEVLTAAYECAVSWLGGVAEVAAEEVAAEAVAVEKAKRGRKR